MFNKKNITKLIHFFLVRFLRIKWVKCCSGQVNKLVQLVMEANNKCLRKSSSHFNGILINSYCLGLLWVIDICSVAPKVILRSENIFCFVNLPQVKRQLFYFVATNWEILSLTFPSLEFVSFGVEKKCSADSVR